MRRVSERGSGRFGSFIALLAVVAVGLAVWNVAPVYFAHYDFADKVEEICRAGRTVARNDEDVVRLLMQEVQRRDLGQWIGPESFRVTTATYGRRIELYYEREVQILPGWKQMLKLSYTAEQKIL